MHLAFDNHEPERMVSLDPREDVRVHVVAVHLEAVLAEVATMRDQLERTLDADVRPLRAVMRRHPNAQDTKTGELHELIRRARRDRLAAASVAAPRPPRQLDADVMVSA